MTGNKMGGITLIVEKLRSVQSVLLLAFFVKVG